MSTAPPRPALRRHQGRDPGGRARAIRRHRLPGHDHPRHRGRRRHRPRDGDALLRQQGGAVRRRRRVRPAACRISATCRATRRGRALVDALPRSLGGRRDADGAAAHRGHQRDRGDRMQASSRRRWRRSSPSSQASRAPAAAARAGLIATQMLGLALCRYVLKLPPVVALKRAGDRAPHRRHRAVLPLRGLSYGQ